MIRIRIRITTLVRCVLAEVCTLPVLLVLRVLVHTRLNIAPWTLHWADLDCSCLDSITRAVARILFQPRQRSEPGVWGGAPSWVQGQSPWSGGQGAKPPKAESFSVAGYPMKWKIYYNFLILRLIHYLAKMWEAAHIQQCCGEESFLHV